MASPELIKRLGRETKAQILVSEACACEFATSELAELLDLLAADAGEKATLGVTVLESLASAGTPVGRIEDLRKAFGAPPGTGRTTVRSAGPHAAQDVRVNTPIRGSASQQTREVHSPFRAKFDASRPAPSPDPIPAPPAPEPPPPPVAAPAGKPTIATGAPAAPRAPLPLRGKAAEILKAGTPGAAGAVPPPTPAPPAAGRTGADPARSMDTFFGDSRGKPTTEAVLGPAAGRPLVLLADDDKRIRMVYRLKLEEKGYSVVEAGDGQEAWKRLQLGGISAAVLDMKMPGLHGLEILSRLADAGQNLPVVICTAYDRMDDEFVVATYPKLRYLTKPVDGEHLAETLMNLLAE